MSSITRKHWLVATGIAVIAHAGITVAWLSADRQAPSLDQGNDGIVMDLTQVVDALPEPEPQTEPEPEPEPEPVPQEQKPKPIVRPTPKVSTPAPVQAPRPPEPTRKAAEKPKAQAPAVGVPKSPPPPDYLGRLRSWLERHKDYPRSSRLHREEGVAYLALTIDRSGTITKSSLAKSSGHPRLDEATLGIANRASPVPALPEDYDGDSLTIVVPIVYKLR
jgi:protein TonB